MAKGDNFAFQPGMLKTLSKSLTSLAKGSVRLADFVESKADQDRGSVQVNLVINSDAHLVAHEAIRVAQLVKDLESAMKIALKTP